MNNKKRFPSEIIAVSLLALSVLVCFRQIIFSGGQLYGSDFILQFWPWKLFVYDSIWSKGILPFWNPYVLSGVPTIANIQVSMFYPLGFLYYIAPPAFAYGYSTMLHCILGSFFMYMFLRNLKVSACGAFLGAIIFTFNGYFMAHLYAGHLSFVQNYIWIPLVICFVYKFLRTLRFKWTICAGLSLGVQILGGFPQIAFYTIITVLAFGAFYLVDSLRFREVKKTVSMGVGIAVIVCTGFGIAAIQLLPTLEFTQLSGRSSGVSYAFATLDSLHPKQLISFFIPDFFGNANGTYWLSPKDWHFWETCSYVSILPLFLMFVPVMGNRDLFKIRWFFIGLVFVSLCLALGKYNPLYPLVYKLPGFHSFRIPAQILFLYVFGIATISGIAMHQIENTNLSKLPAQLMAFLGIGGIFLLILLVMVHHPTRGFFFYLFKAVAEAPVDNAIVEMIPGTIRLATTRSALLFFSGAALLVLVRYKKISTTFFTMAALAMVLVDLGFYSTQFVRPYKFAISEEKEAIAQQLRDDTKKGRVSMSNLLFELNYGSLYRFATIDGYDPLVLERYILFLQQSQGLALNRHVITTFFINNYKHKFLKMLGLKYVVQDGGIIELDAPIPRAILVQKAVVKSPEEILKFMGSKQFDPLSTVVFEQDTKSFEQPNSTQEPFQGTCTVTYADFESIKIQSESNQSCFLVLSEIFYPGWQAKVDGKWAPIIRGNYLFRVVPLKKGSHEIEMRFVCRSFQVGALITIATMIGLAVLFITTKRRIKKT